MRDQVRNQQYGMLELSEGASPSARRVFVGFTDMVGFTRLGERIEITEIGRLLGRLGELAREAVQPPTRIVKTIGDAIMFVSPAPESLLGDLAGPDGAGRRGGRGIPRSTRAWRRESPSAGRATGTGPR
jgi:class 3 adenylate cyclase